MAMRSNTEAYQEWFVLEDYPDKRTSKEKSVNYMAATKRGLEAEAKETQSQSHIVERGGGGNNL